MHFSRAWLHPLLPVVAIAAFAVAVFEPATGERLPLGARVREVQDRGVPWEGRYAGRTESGLYVLECGKAFVLAERREFTRIE